MSAALNIDTPLNIRTTKVRLKKFIQATEPFLTIRNMQGHLPWQYVSPHA